MKISLGPVLYYWPRNTLFRFYDSIATSAAQVVYLGEAVCSRRHEMRMPDWLDIAQMLRDAGKEVVLSTQILLESNSDVSAMHKIAANAEFRVEANDMGAVHRLASRDFVAGSHLNIYNLPSLQWMAGLGARRWVIPLEMSRDDLALVQAARPENLETEVFAYGRMPLAFSARCFTARHHNQPKDDCQFSCMQDPDGLLLKTREGQDFLVLNGIQTQSAHVYNLVDQLNDMRSLGVDIVRISPQSIGTGEVIDLFDQALRHEMAPSDVLERMQPLMPAAPCNGYWLGQPGMEQVATAGSLT
jgi:O2-independent ubiquinone biosynthesis protein UbiV